MKIAVIGSRGFPGTQGGVEKHCEKLYTHLAELGCNITVFTRRPYVDPNINTYNGVSLISLSCPGNKYLEAVIHTFKSLFYARKLNPDIVHLHAIGPSLFAVLARAFGMNVVVTNHGPDYRRKKWPWPARIFLIFCERIGVTFANKVIAVAGNISEYLKLKYGINAIVIPNGVDIPDIIESDNSLREWGLQKKKYILSVGRLVPEKGFDYLIDAFNELQVFPKHNDNPRAILQGDCKSQVEGWQLVIVGGADHEDKHSRNLKNKAGNNENITLTGFITGRPLEELYSNAGLFVLPSYYEGLPIALLEAMSYGLSCIASDIPANRNIEISDKRFFKAGDVTSLKSKIKEIINDPWEEEESRNQIEMIAENYSWEKISEKTLLVYKDVLS